MNKNKTTYGHNSSNDEIIDKLINETNLFSDLFNPDMNEEIVNIEEKRFLIKQKERNGIAGVLYLRLYNCYMVFYEISNTLRRYDFAYSTDRNCNENNFKLSTEYFFKKEIENYISLCFKK